MNIIKVNDFESLSEAMAQIMIDEVKSNPHANICLATGGSPELAYRRFVEMVKEQNLDLSHVLFTKLDEWCGLDPENEATCEKYIQDFIIKPLGISKDNYIAMMPNASDFNQEVLKVEDSLKNHPISLCILGLGRNGHLGLNEPSEFLQSDVHVIALDPLTKTHPMIVNDNVEKGMTIGMAGILQSEKVVMLITGANKEAIVKEFFTKQVTTKLPASFLWLHPKTTVIVQEDLYQV